MEDGLLSLKWNNHKTTFFDILRVLREKANYTDATIAVEGKFYPVHKLVMSTCSEYFSEIFERTPCKSPVVVLKDVRSQDMDALLDYMYLGEVNVNQNDLASLLKTAECLRIKGLAVPDEDPIKARKNLPDDRRESPPPKRRRHEDSTSSSASAQLPPRPVSPSAPSPSKATAGGQAQAPPVQHSSVPPGPGPVPVPKSQPDLDQGLDPPPMVKVEMEEAEDPDDGYRRDNSFDGGPGNDGDGGDFGSEVSKSEHDPDNYGGGSYAGPSLQQGGDLPWEEGDSSSFPPEGFSGDLPAGQQPQGATRLELMSDRSSPLLPPPPSAHTHLRHFHRVASLHAAVGEGLRLATPAASIQPGSSRGGVLGTSGGGIVGDGGNFDLSPEVFHPASSANSSCQPLTFSEHLRLAYSWNDSLNNGASVLDLASVQAKVKPRVCGHCGKMFQFNNDLRKHIRTHTGEKPYTCPYCSYRATQKVHLRSHILRRHRTTHDPNQDG